MWPFNRSPKPPRPIATANASRVILAHWLAFAAWKGKIADLKLRDEIRRAFRLDEIRPVLADDGRLAHLHLPVEMPPLVKAPQGNPHAAAAAERANELAQLKAQEEWIRQPYTCELSPAAVKLIAKALAGHPTPPNFGPWLLPLLLALEEDRG